MKVFLIFYNLESEWVILQQIQHHQNCCFLCSLVALQSSPAGWCLAAWKEEWAGTCQMCSGTVPGAGPSQEQGVGRAVSQGSPAVWVNQSIYFILWRHLSDPINPSTAHIHPPQGLVLILLHWPKLFIVVFVHGGVCVQAHGMVEDWLWLKEFSTAFMMIFYYPVFQSNSTSSIANLFIHEMFLWITVSPQCCLKFVLTHFLLQVLKIFYLYLFDMII